MQLVQMYFQRLVDRASSSCGAKTLVCSGTVDGTVGACLGQEPGVQTYLGLAAVSAWGWTLAVSWHWHWPMALVLIGSLVGGGCAPHRTSALVGLGNAWTELFRNIPLIVQLFIWYFVVPELRALRSRALPSVAAGGFGLGVFYFSADQSEQVRAGIQSIPQSGKSYAGLGDGAQPCRKPTDLCCCRWPFAWSSRRLTSESHERCQEQLGGLCALSVLELTQFARQVGEETSRPIETYAMVVTVLYFISAFCRLLDGIGGGACGACAGRRGGGRSSEPRLLLSSPAEFLQQASSLNGLLFSITLDGGGHPGSAASCWARCLALMRLSGIAGLGSIPAGCGLCEPDAIHPPGDGHPVVLLARALFDRPLDQTPTTSAFVTFTLFEAAYLLRDHAGRHSERCPKGQQQAGYARRHELRTNHDNSWCCRRPSATCCPCC